MANVTVNAPFGVSVFEKLRETLSAYKVSRAVARDYQETYNELKALSDRELADIGVGRGDIADIAREHAYGA